MESRLPKQVSHFRYLDVFLIAVFFVSNLTALAFWMNSWLVSTTFHYIAPQIVMACANCLLWLLAAAVMYIDLKRVGDMQEYLKLWKQQKAMLAFITVAFCSIFWSIDPWVSAYKFFLLLAATAVGFFLGKRASLARMLDLLAWFFSIILLLSMALSLLLPGTGTAEGFPYYGAWCGPFWNRNHLGSLAALSCLVFFARLLARPPRRFWLLAVNLSMLAISALIVYKAKSATGYVLMAVLLGAFLILFFWQKYRCHLRRKHYLLFIALLVAASLVALSRLDLIFNLLNRQPTLTGRLPMWNFLVDQVIGSSPVVGYGFGAIWSMGIFREGIRYAVNWPYQLVIADNGYFDILLSVGIAGFLPFLMVFLQAWIGSFRQLLASKTGTGIFPIAFMLYALIANLSFSMFLETETFIWVLLAAILVKRSNPESQDDRVAE